jgi:hypothetical protein
MFYWVHNASLFLIFFDFFFLLRLFGLSKFLGESWGLEYMHVLGDPHGDM